MMLTMKMYIHSFIKIVVIFEIHFIFLESVGEIVNKLLTHKMEYFLTLSPKAFGL